MTFTQNSTHNWRVYGHEWAVEHLRKSMANNRIRHAYLFTGVESVGKTTLARAFAMALNCTYDDKNARPCGECRSCKLVFSGNHPDFIFAEPDANTGALKIEEIRRVCSTLALKPFEARYRIAVFPSFQNAQDRAQDALLKTLEEPPPYAVLMLFADSADSLLPTITSRSQRIHLRPLPIAQVKALMDDKGINPDNADLLARISFGRPGWALNALEDPDTFPQRDAALNMLMEALNGNYTVRFDMAQELSKDRLAASPLLELWQSYWRDVLLVSTRTEVPVSNADRLEDLQHIAASITPQAALDALNATRRTLEHITTTNVNLRLALEVMFLDYPH